MMSSTKTLSSARFMRGVIVYFSTSIQLFAETEHLGREIVLSFMMRQVWAPLLLLTFYLLGSGEEEKLLI